MAREKRSFITNAAALCRCAESARRRSLCGGRQLRSRCAIARRPLSAAHGPLFRHTMVVCCGGGRACEGTRRNTFLRPPPPVRERFTPSLVDRSHPSHARTPPGRRFLSDGPSSAAAAKGTRAPAHSPLVPSPSSSSFAPLFYFVFFPAFFDFVLFFIRAHTWLWHTTKMAAKCHERHGRRSPTRRYYTISTTYVSSFAPLSIFSGFTRKSANNIIARARARDSGNVVSYSFADGRYARVGESLWGRFSFFSRKLISPHRAQVPGPLATDLL